MAIAAKALADGQLAAAKGTLYTVPGSTVTYITYMSFLNAGASTETVIIYLNTSGTSREIVNATLSPGDSLRFDGRLSLEAADLIEGETTNATSVDYVITGGEEA